MRAHVLRVEELQTVVVEGPEILFLARACGSVSAVGRDGVAGHKRTCPCQVESRSPPEVSCPALHARPGPDRVRKWVIGGRRGVVRNRYAAAIVHVLVHVGAARAGPAHGRIERVFGEREVVWRALAGRERG
jgi:hypothetical protein